MAVGVLPINIASAYMALAVVLSVLVVLGRGWLQRSYVASLPPTAMDRYSALIRSLLVAAAIVMLAPGQPAEAQSSVVVTGESAPELKIYDDTLTQILRTWSVPGAALAVFKDGRLVLARGYGFADTDSGRAVQPDTPFRVASASKPFTAVAALKLAQDDRLDLDAPILPMLADLLPSGGPADPRLARVTTRMVLRHAGGWDRGRSFDPMFLPWSNRAADALGASRPATCATIARFMLTQPLDFEPGTGYAYSNFGYCLLSLIVERGAGKSYERYLTRDLLPTLGITHMRLGHTALNERDAAEPKYYDYPGANFGTTVFGNTDTQVPRPDGSFYLEAMAGNSGWLGSAIDLARFALRVGATDGSSPLTADTIQAMLERPLDIWQNTQSYYSLGWLVRPMASDAIWWHTGSLPGSTSLVVRAANGTAWAILFNGRPQDSENFSRVVDRSLWQALARVTSWPAHDLSGRYR